MATSPLSTGQDSALLMMPIMYLFPPKATNWTKIQAPVTYPGLPLWPHWSSRFKHVTFCFWNRPSLYLPQSPYTGCFSAWPFIFLSFTFLFTCPLPLRSHPRLSAILLLSCTAFWREFITFWNFRICLLALLPHRNVSSINMGTLFVIFMWHLEKCLVYIRH